MPGVWRYYWASERDDGDRAMSVQRAEGLIMSEALTRCPPADEAEREALVEAFEMIELGARHGQSRGMNLTAEEESNDG
jgi:hypothetical protein